MRNSYAVNWTKIVQIIFFITIATSVALPGFCYDQHDSDTHHAHESIDDPVAEESHSHTHRHGPGEPEHTHEHSHNVPSGNSFDLKVVALNQAFVISPIAFHIISYPLNPTLIPQNISRSIFRPPIS